MLTGGWQICPSSFGSLTPTNTTDIIRETMGFGVLVMFFQIFMKINIHLLKT